MTGSLQTKKGRKYYYAVLNVKDINGKRKTKWINTDTPVAGNNKRRADSALKTIIAKYEEEEKLGIAPECDILFSEFMEQWLESVKDKIEVNTLESYRYALNHVVPYFRKKGTKLKDLTPLIIQNYYSDKSKEGLGSNTILKHHSNIHRALNKALKLNLIPYNPADRVELPKKKKFEASTYNEQQIKELLNKVRGNQIEAAVTITSYLGLRRSEVLGLKWSSVDLEKKKMIIQTTVVRAKTTIVKDTTKNKSSHRTLSIPDALNDYLINLKRKQEEQKKLFGNCYNENDWICKKDDGTPINPTTLSYYYQTLLTETGFPHIRFHDLRHSTASMLINAGCEIYEIKELLGHSQIATTVDIYGHLDYKAKQRMADKINGIINDVN